MLSIVVTTQPPHQYRFKLLSESGHTLLSSPRFITQDACYDTIESLKTFASFDMHYLYETAGIKLYFNLIDDNGYLIGTSELFNTPEEREEAIKLVSNYARYATVLKAGVQ